MSNHTAAPAHVTNYVETTGPVTCVGILLDDEDDARFAAMDEVSSNVSPIDSHRMSWGWEFTFETADLDWY